VQFVTVKVHKGGDDEAAANEDRGYSGQALHIIGLLVAAYSGLFRLRKPVSMSGQYL
jgi:hypothetical protein